MLTVDLSARESHFLDHLADVWLALPEQVRGALYVSTQDMVEQAHQLGLGEATIGWPLRGIKMGPILVASWGDLRVASRTRRKIILAEHGAGQSYSGRHKSYVGGVGRDKVGLFLVPGEHAAARNRRYYPHIPNAVVGSPRVDRLRDIQRIGPPTVAISFHWRCLVCPETGSAIDDFAPELVATTARLQESGIRIVGHAHPRIAEEASNLYATAGIEFVPTFDEVVARADVYAVDNSSTLFEFAALGRPVVVLNANAYRRDSAHGLRFWTEADVGIHAGPGTLASSLLAAMEDPPAVAASRRAAVARAYAVADGTSAQRAAQAIMSTLLGGRPRCLVCGENHAQCGGPTDVIGVDERIKERVPMAGTLKRYPNPARAGAFLKLSDADARRMGLLGQELDTPARPAPPVDVTNTGGDLVTSTTVGSDRPEGSLIPAGPTRRARAAKADADATAGSADGGTEDDGADDEQDGHLAPVTAPKSSRRRRVVDNPKA